MNTYNNLLITKESFLGIITINRPEQLNALNMETFKELDSALKELQDDCRVILFTGSGSKAFVAGADVKEFSKFSPQQAEVLSKDGQAFFNEVELSPVPTIACINGFALGGGLELAMSCHFRICSNNAKFGLPESSLGVIPGYGGTQRLSQLINKGRALEMMLTAKMIDAQTALNYGLVNHVFEPKELMENGQKIARSIARNSPNAIKEIIAITHHNASFNTGLILESERFGACFGEPDFKEGVHAFLEKRNPSF